MSVSRTGSGVQPGAFKVSCFTHPVERRPVSRLAHRLVLFLTPGCRRKTSVLDCQASCRLNAAASRRDVSWAKVTCCVVSSLPDYVLTRQVVCVYGQLPYVGPSRMRSVFETVYFPVSSCCQAGGKRCWCTSTVVVDETALS